MRKMLTILFLISATAWAKPKPPKETVVLVGEGIAGSGIITDLYLILPDGSQAQADCIITFKSCTLEPFHPEKRVGKPCYEVATESIVSCFEMESYYADRVGNNITLYGAAGGVTFHIKRAWESLTLGAPPSHSPPWTAVCNDNTISYSQDRSGTCADHKGVRLWRESGPSSK